MHTLENLFQKVQSISYRENVRQSFPKNATSRVAFCLDVCVVALGVRAGYLLDTFAPVEGEKTLYRLLLELRQVSNVFTNVRVVYSKEADQFFFINHTLFMQSLGNLDSRNSEFQTKFILLGEQAQIIPPPIEVTMAARHIAEATTEPIALPENLSTSTLIALAGFLLEYPISYLPAEPASSQISSLNGVPLDLYQYTLIMPNTNHKEEEQQHVLLKFSSVAGLSDSEPSLKPDRIIEMLNKLFARRIASISGSWTSRVSHTVVVKDRITM